MEVITTILLCTVGFLVYLVNANNNEILKLKHSQRDIERETAQFLTEKDEEILSLKRQLTSEKNKLLRQPTVNGIETSNLKKQLDKNRGEIQDLQKKLHEKEKIISELKEQVTDAENMVAIEQYGNEKLERELRALKLKNFSSQTGVENIEISSLKNQIIKRENDVQTLNQILSALKNENEQLRIKVKNLENGTLPGIDWQPLKPSRQKKPKKFLRVIFTKGSNRFFDYLLGDNRGIKVGDFVMVSYFDKKKKKSELTAAQVIYISGENEFSENATSKIIGKADYPKW